MEKPKEIKKPKATKKATAKPTTAKKKAAPKKKAKQKAEQKKDRSKTGRFTKGNKAAEKWTVESVTQILQEMWRTVATDDEGNIAKNPVRANDIKTLAEICLIHDVGHDTWSYWADKFKDEPSVLRIIKKIEWVLENRMVYSGQTMDIFVLKNKYGYNDQRAMDLTTKGKELPKAEPKTVTFIPAEALTQEMIDKLMNNAGNDWDSNESVSETG